MTWAAYGPQNPSSDGIRWRQLSEAVNRAARVPAGQGQENPAHDKRPQQDSNLRSRLRRPLLSPLSYGGCATPKGTSRRPPTDTSAACPGDGPSEASSAAAHTDSRPGSAGLPPSSGCLTRPIFRPNV
jgi:hypothetical protein